MTEMKRCFVVSQIGDDDSQERIHADWFLQGIVEPVFDARSDFIVDRADKIAHPGLIDAQVIERLLSAEIVVADLTGLNPNVFYEIGIRHMVQKPIIHMHEVGQRIPFDVSLYRSIAFSRVHPRDLVAAREKLQHAVDVVLSPDYQVENPVTNARGRLRLENAATPEQKVVIDQLRAIEDRLAGLENPARPQTRLRLRPNVHPYINDKNYVSTYKIGEIVEHAKFGVGEIIEIEASKLTIQFSAPVGQKRVVDAFVYYPEA